MLEILKEKGNIIDEDILLISILSIKGQDYEIKPSLTNEGIIYSIEGKVLPIDRLQELERRGIFEIKSYTSFIACPVCKNLNLSIKFVCPMCKSDTLIKADFIVHYECGYVATVQEFTRNDVYLCPKCKKVLKTVGIDYGRPGISFRCNSCFNVFQFPLVLIKCNNNHEFKVDETEIINYPIYKLGKNVSYYSKLTNILYHTSLRINFEKNLNALVFSSVSGISGSRHFFPLVIKKDDNLVAAVEIILDISELHNILLKTIVKSLDIDGKVFLIMMQKLDVSKFAAILNPERIKIINVNSEEEIPEKIISNL
jgi:hypothetical protein